METFFRLFERIGNNLDQTVLIFSSTVIVAVLVYWHADKTTDFDLRHLVIDSSTNRLSLFKIGQVTALLVSTWTMIHETKVGRLSEWLFLGYMALWSGSNLLSKYIDTRAESTTSSTKVE